MIQIGDVHTTFCQEEGILLQKHRDRNGRCIAILSKSIGVRGQFDLPSFYDSVEFNVVLLLKTALWAWRIELLVNNCSICENMEAILLSFVRTVVKGHGNSDGSQVTTRLHGNCNHC